MASSLRLRSIPLRLTSSNMAAGGKLSRQLALPSGDVLSRTIKMEEAKFAGKGEFFFLPFVSPTLAEAGANKPWLQEVPDPTTHRHVEYVG